ncbi:MAG: DUF3857 domain-containing protein [bacterium]|nr:DUF3857 domain-containing protein [bacterium]
MTLLELTRRIRPRPLVLAAVLAHFAAGAGASSTEPWIETPFTAEAGAVITAAEELTAGAGSPVVVLYRDTSYAFDAAGRATYRQRLVYRILSVDGLEGWSATEIGWEPWHQERPQVRARVISATGIEYWLDAATLSESPAPATALDLYGDRRILEAPLPAVTVGAVVEEEVLVRDKEPLFAAGTAEVHHLKMFAPVERGRLTLEAPIDLPLRYGVRLQPELEPHREVRDQRVYLNFEYRDMPAVESIETGLPSHQARFPHVAFSTGGSWQEIAELYSQIVDEKIGDGRVAALLGSLPDPAGSQTERIAQLLARVHEEVRYTGLELGAASIIPATPETTLQRKFGDCKDQATLLIALLREEGIPAYVALLNAGFGKDVDTQLPGFGRFSHAIVYIPASPPIWIDTTDPTARAGELPAVDQGRWALIASPNTENLIRTPSAQAADNLTIETRRIFMAGHGPARCVETSEYHGEPERQQRRMTSSSDRESRREAYRSYVQSAYLAEELGTVEESDPEDISRPFTLSLEALRCGRVVTDLNEAVVAIRFENLVSTLPSIIRTGNAPRHGDFVIDQPFVTEWRYQIVPPTGFAPRSLPAEERREFGPARFSRGIRVEEGEVYAHFRFDSGARRLTPEQFNATRSGVQELLSEEPLLLWFDHLGAAELAAGHARKAIELYRHFAELEPEETIHRVRLSQALLTVGLGGEARRQAGLAAELDPTSATAFWALGLALEYNEIGQRFAPGFDRPAAVAALERAVELDPDDQVPRSELAILLEHDSEGKRYGAPAELDRAIEEYRKLRADFENSALDLNLILALYWAERWEELADATLEVSDSQAGKYLRLVALSILQDPEAAIRESGNLSSTQEEQITLLSQAAHHLLIARHYQEAAALLRRAARGAPNPTAVLTRAEVLAKARPHEEATLQVADPQSLARSLMVALSRNDLDQETLEQLFLPEYLADRDAEGTALGVAFQQMRQEQVRSSDDLPVDVVMDLALSVLEATVEGDDSRGYRVRMANDVVGNVFAFRVYITTFEDQYRIAAVDTEYGQIAKEALRRVDRGDLESARQWLDWARERISARDSDDPYGFVPFAGYWTKGQEAGVEQVRLAAAILMANQLEAAEAVPILQEALAGSEDEPTRRIVQVALMSAYLGAEEDALLAELATTLLEREPSSGVAFRRRCRVLITTGRWEELDRVAGERLRALPDDPDALRYLAQSALWHRQADRVVELFERLRELDKLEAQDYNLWAWLLLFQDPVPEEALALAQRGVTLSGYRQRAILHTLASLFVELGRPTEAYQAIVQSLELNDDPVPDSDDWYVFGRIAEEYGFAELAREYYRKVKKPEEPDEEVYSAFELAQKRLKGLPKPGKRR